MSDFITILKNTVVASTDTGITTTDQFKNIGGAELIDKLRLLPSGNKDGSHFIRTSLQVLNNGQCMSRSDANIQSLADLVIIDCDKHVNEDGHEMDGAPNPSNIHQALKSMNIGHIIYGSYSHYTGAKGNRYRIILTTKEPYTKQQLPTIIETCVLLINKHIDDGILAYAKENNVFAQGWYHPRRPVDSLVELLYFEYLEGESIVVPALNILPPNNHIAPSRKTMPGWGTSPIQRFNDENPITVLLSQYGYKRKLVTSDYEKWLSPESSSGVAGITVKGNKFFSHHNDQFKDGYWHDTFDLMKGREGISAKEAINKISMPIIRHSTHFHDNFKRQLTNEFPAPQPLPESRPAVMSFKDQMLPESIREYVFDIANRQQSLPDFVAVAAIVGLSGLLGRKVLIYPKQFDDWSVTPNQWGAIIGRPSAMKSPSMKEALKPLRHFDNKAAQKFEADKKNYEEECQFIKLEKSLAEHTAKNALKSNKYQEAREALRTASCPASPVRERLVINDATVEKLGELLNENPNGLILVRDELSGWLAKLNKEEYQADRAFYLECFDGNGHYTYDRIGRGTIEIENCTLSIIGGIQPSKLAPLVRDAVRGVADDGLIQRFQFAIWPDDIGSWQWIDRVPNQQARMKYNAVFERLRNLNLSMENEEPVHLRFTSDAQESFIIWMQEIQDAARNPEIHPALESHMLKMPQTIAGLALLFEIIDGGSEAVGVQAIAKALYWADYLLSHAKRLYSLAINHGLDGAKLILKRKSKISSPFTARDIQRKGWSGLDSIEAVTEALNWLIDYGHIYVRPVSAADTNGRPKISYEWADINYSSEAK